MARKIAPEDFARVQLLSDAQLSPDGHTAAFIRRRIDREKNKNRGEIWVVRVDGGGPRQYTGGDWSDSSPRWSPDGSQLAFLSDRGKPKAQVYLISTAGGESRGLNLLETEGRIGGIRWSPDGSRIAFTFWETPEQYRKERADERRIRELPAPPRRHTRLDYRFDGFGYYDDSFWQIGVVDVGSGECCSLTSGAFHCGLPVWSPDGSTLAFLSDRRDDRDIAPAHDDIWTVSLSGEGLSRVPSPPGRKSSLARSPDGQSFAYAGNPDPDDQWGTLNTRMYVLPATGDEKARDLTGHTDLSLGYFTLSDLHDAGAGDLVTWSPDSLSLFCAISTQGDTRLARVNLHDPEIRFLTPSSAEIGSYSVSKDGRHFAVTLGSPAAPHELFAAPVDRVGEILTQCTDLNRSWLAEVDVVPQDPIRIPTDGADLAGWMILPRGMGEGERRPFVLYVHGGPHMQYGSILFHEMQVLAAEGYVVIFTNPRGSKGYGESHTTAINRCWGGPDFDDIMGAVDWAVASGHVDESRMAIMGGSYGGFMAAWAIGHTNRFACAIADRLVSNLNSMSGTCDFTWRPNRNFEGNAWDDPGPLWNRSPLAYAGQIETPLLLIHSDGDLRCPVSQAEELFAALRLQRKPVELVRYSAETSHDLSRTGPPDLRLHRLQTNLEWLRRWLRPPAASASDLDPSGNP